MDTTRKAICCIGHITLDKIITPSSTAYIPGGTAWYFGHAMASLGDADFSLLTAVGPESADAVESLRTRGVDVTALPSRQSVFFENSYGRDTNKRSQRVLAKADPFTVEAVGEAEATVFHLGTLLADDFPPATIPCLASRGLLSVDVQGFLREVRGDKVFPVDWTEKDRLLPYVTFLKANEEEAQVLTGLSDPRLAARRLGQMGVREAIVTLGDKGSIIWDGSEMHEIPAFPAPGAVDATGCGDTYMAGYLHRRAHGASADEAGRFAAAMCTLKLRKSGPFTGSETDVAGLLTTKTAAAHPPH